MSARAWLRAARPLAHANIAPPLVLGQALAYAAGAGFDPALAALAHGFGVLDHLFIVFANDVADHEADAHAEPPTPFSGGSRVLQDGLLTPGRLAGAAALAAIALLALSCAAALLARPLTPLFALAAIALLAAYSFPPLRLAYRGGGELLQGLGVGLVLPLLGFYLQSGRIAGAPWPLLSLLVVLGAASNVITALPDARGDRRAGKRTWPVRRGERRAARDALLALALGLALAAPLVPHAAVLAVPALSALGAAIEHARGRRARGLRFVLFAAGAITIFQLGLALDLFVSG